MTKTEFHAAVVRKLNEASVMFAIDMSDVEIRLDIKGYCTAGYAGIKAGQYFVRFNPLAIEKLPELMVSSVIPHEVAHIVCQKKWDNFTHNVQWQHVAIALGDTGKGIRTCDLEGIKPEGYQPRRMSRYEYTSDAGGKFVLTAIRHNRIQQKGYTYATASGAKIAAQHFVRAL